MRLGWHMAKHTLMKGSYPGSFLMHVYSRLQLHLNVLYSVGVHENYMYVLPGAHANYMSWGSVSHFACMNTTSREHNFCETLWNIQRQLQSTVRISLGMRLGRTKCTMIHAVSGLLHHWGRWSTAGHHECRHIYTVFYHHVVNGNTQKCVLKWFTCWFFTGRTTPFNMAYNTWKHHSQVSPILKHILKCYSSYSSSPVILLFHLLASIKFPIH